MILQSLLGDNFLVLRISWKINFGQCIILCPLQLNNQDNMLTFSGDLNS